MARLERSYACAPPAARPAPSLNSALSAGTASRANNSRFAFEARPNGISFEAANPRHAHQWKLFETIKLPDGKVLIPGVIDSKTNCVAHPGLVAERISRYAKLVGRENIIAGTDCGFGTWVGQAAVTPGIVWAKLKSLAEGARLASREL